MRAKSHRYPESSECYTDTTYYDPEDKYLDIGFQMLKSINIKRYPEFSYLEKLFINNNNLKQLPDPQYLPKIKELVCSYNILTHIPFYPNLIKLDISHNQVQNINVYNQSKLLYLDCSFNKNIETRIFLPECRELYVNDANISKLEINYFPNLRILDCSNNNISRISSLSTLIELNIQNNHITELPSYPQLVRIMADNNKLCYVPTFPNLLSLSVSYNNIVKITDQPLLKKLVANNNSVIELGNLPKLKFFDLSFNKLNSVTIPSSAKYIFLQFNNFVSVDIDNCIGCVKELQVDFNIYSRIYSKYFDNIYAINIQTNRDKLHYYLQQYSQLSNEHIVNQILNKFNGIKFKEHTKKLFGISVGLYELIFVSQTIKNTSDKESYDKYFQSVLQTDYFKKFYEFIQYVYYNSIIVTLYFNGYIS
ncbi:hypothetical protein [Acanthamoeba polyphaga mimivirus]|nr:hypothetical protein [Acanthamoeba castellanii mamavirus]EJN40821.1 hypothetical protein lvs_R317 [Acanthamoeba polyphaga lentillevirus]UMZ08100.1 hypothetical protein [Acanthamoeba polyphaga mimivirus]